MELNSVIFPAPPPSYTIRDFDGELIWIPKPNLQFSIPCLLLKSEEGSNKIMLYFHGNAEDLKLSYELIDLFRTVLHVHVLAVEYPGYGLYKGKTSEKSIVEDAEIVYDFIKSRFQLRSRDIFVFGRSIGTGPATHVARFRKVGCLLLMSAYTSIKAVVKNVAKGLSMFVKERFNNIENVRHINCPTFLVHGKKDKLIPFSHSKLLQENCKGPCSLFIPSDMDHDRFDYCDDLVLPISAFLLQSRIQITNEVEALRELPECLAPSPGQQLRKTGGRYFKILKKFS